MPSYYLSLPYLFLKFWYLEAPVSLIKYSFSLNHAALEFLSIPLMLRTYFRPIKNEYRKGLVWFSIGMGIFIKSLLLLVGFLIFALLIFAELLALVFFVLWPFVTIYLLFI